jgi:hypothetical protein
MIPVPGKLLAEVTGIVVAVLVILAVSVVVASFAASTRSESESID